MTAEAGRHLQTEMGADRLHLRDDPRLETHPAGARHVRGNQGVLERGRKRRELLSSAGELGERTPGEIADLAVPGEPRRLLERLHVDDGRLAEDRCLRKRLRQRMRLAPYLAGA